MNSNNQKYRIIFHIDMNCFFASCHIAEDPSLTGIPLVVAHNDKARKSIILTASYEARKFGIYTTMLTGEAIKLCPSIKIIEPNYELYKHYSDMFFEYLFTITPLIEIMSIDEGFLDVTDYVKPEDAVKLAERIQNTLYNEFNLPCSIGIAPNKFLAKMGSDLKKPMGISVVRKRELDKTIWPLDIKEMFGVGKKSQPILRSIGINTIGDAANYKDKALLEKTVGPAFASYLITRANGIDDSPVTLNNADDMSSISNEHTFDYNVNSIEMVKTTIKVLAGSVCERMRSHDYGAFNFGIKIKYNDFTVVQRSRSISKASNDDYAVSRIACELFDEYNDPTKTVRLIGVFCNRLSKVTQETPKRLNLFDDLDKEEKQLEVNKLLNNINKIVGSNIIGVGVKDIKNDKKL